MSSCLPLLVLFLAFLASVAYGSHLRSGIVSWQVSGTNTASFNVQLGMRYSFQVLTLGQTYKFGTAIQFGDGQGFDPTYVASAISVIEDYTILQATFTHVYATPVDASSNPWRVSYNLNARIGNSLNNANVNMQLETFVDLRDPTNASPVSSQFTRVTILQGLGTLTIPISGTDLYNRPLSFRFATPTEMGGASLTQPPGLQLDTNTGIMTWNTTKVAAGLWSTQAFVVNSLTKTPVDFLIKVIQPISTCSTSCSNVNTACVTDSDCVGCAGSAGTKCITNQAPVLIPPTPEYGSYYCLRTPAEIKFNVTAIKYNATNPAAEISILTGALPSGSVMAKQSGVNPVTAEFSWTPTSSQTGKYTVCFAAVDDVAYMAGQSCVYITVNADPYAPNVASVLPSAGHITGGSVVTVHGANYTNAGGIQCSFGGRVSSGTYLTSSTVACVVPSQLAIGYVDVSVSCVCSIWSTNTTFYYFDTPGLASVVTPVPYMDQQATNFTVIGSLLYDFSPRCRVNGTLTLATVINETTAICQLPALENGNYVLSISNDGEHFSNQLPFTVLGVPVLVNIYDEFFIPIASPTVVRVGGRRFSSLGAFSCLFDGTAPGISENFLNTTYASCPTNGLSVGSHTLSVSNDGVHYSSAVSFVVSPVAHLNYTDAPRFIPDLSSRTLVIFGSDFIDTALLVCRFNQSLTVSATFINASAVSCLLPGLSNGYFNVSASNNGVFYSNSLTLLVLGVPVISTVPDELLFPIATAFSLTALGDRFSNLGNQTCSVDGSIIPVIFVSTTNVSCSVGALAVGSHILKVSNDGESLYSSPFTFHVHPIPVINATNLPVFVSHSPSTLVIVHGSQFVNSSLLTCEFNSSLRVAATFINDSAVSCLFPSFAAYFVNVTVSNNGLAFSNSLHLPALGIPTVAFIPNQHWFPVMSPFSIYLIGERFSGLESFTCRFDSASTGVLGVVTNTSYASCPTGGLSAGTHTISVSNDGIRYSDTASFVIYPVPHLNYTDAPHFIPDMQSRTLTVTGYDYMNLAQLSCRFNSGAPVAVTYVNDSAVSCLFPASSNGVVNLTVSNNGLYYSNNITLLVVGIPVIASIPNQIYFPVNYPFTVNVVGSKFSDLGTPMCNIDGQANAAVYHNTTYISCPTTGLSSGDHLLRLSNDGVQYSSAVTFNILPVPYLNYTDAPAVINDMTTRFVFATGGQFVNIPQLKCLVNGTGVLTTFVTGTTLVCQYPLLSNGYVNISVTNNGIYHSNSLTQFVLGIPVVNGNNLPDAYQAGMTRQVTIYGDRFYDSSMLVCLVDSVSVPVTYLNNSAVRCSVPSLAVGAHTITVGNDVTKMSTVTYSFLVYDVPQVTQLLPFYLLQSTVASSVTNLTVSGSNFLNTARLRCKVNDVIVPVFFISNAQVKCQLPAMSQLGNVSVEIANDANIFVSGPYLSIIWITPTAGATQGGSTITLYGKQATSPESGVCVFGSTSVPYSSWYGPVANRTVVCTVPSVTSAGLATLLTMNDGQGSISAPFMFYDEPTLSVVEPLQLYSFTGGVISISGSGFRNQSYLAPYGLHGSLSCQLNTSSGLFVVPATMTVDNIQVTCVAPMSFSGPATVRVSLVGSFSNRLPSRSFGYFDRLLTTVGPTSSGYLVTIQGSFIDVNDLFSCQFGSLSSVGTRVNASVVTCPIPSSLLPSTVTVSLARNGLNPVTTTPNFTALAIGTLSRVYSGSLRGGDVITLSGRSFVNPNSQTSILCVFGSAVSPATVSIDGNVSCLVPAAANEGAVNLTLINESGWPTQWIYSYYDLPTMHVTPMLPRQNASETLNISISSVASGSRPAKLTFTCLSCDFVSSSQIVSSRRLLAGAGSSLTIDTSVKAPQTIIDTVMYRPWPNYIGNDSIAVSGLVTSFPPELTFSSQFAVQVVAVNQRPSFHALNSLTVVTGQSVKLVGWANQISPGSVSESWQTTWFTVSVLTNRHLFTELPSLTPSGDLVFASSLAASGFTSVLEVIIFDNGGTAFGGIDRSLPFNVTISFDSSLSALTGDSIIPIIAAIAAIVGCCCLLMLGLGIFYFFRWRAQQDPQKAPFKVTTNEYLRVSTKDLLNTPTGSPQLAEVDKLELMLNASPAGVRKTLSTDTLLKTDSSPSIKYMDNSREQELDELSEIAVSGSTTSLTNPRSESELLQAVNIAPKRMSTKVPVAARGNARASLIGLLATRADAGSMGTRVDLVPRVGRLAMKAQRVNQLPTL